MRDLSQLLIRGHLGLGDQILCNAIYRHYATTNHVFIPCKRHNVPSLNFMLRDLPNVTVLAVADDAEADAFCRQAEAKGHSVLRLGMFGTPPFVGATFDVDIFRQAGVPFSARWTDWQCVREPERELPVPEYEYAFVHADGLRGFIIDLKRLPAELPWECVDPSLTKNIFNYWGLIENATEIHVIDSCFAILADSIPLKARRKVVHVYARPGALPPQFSPGWEVLRK